MTGAVALAMTSPAMAQVDQRQAPETTTASGAPETSVSETIAVEEIIVTAQKRSERSQDVPVPLTALSSDALIQNNQTRLEDYYSAVPGLNLTTGLTGGSVVSIRGVITSSSTNPTVATIVDDLPYGSSTSLGGGILAPDFDPSDLQRIEVLRGPQGTLYGAASLGGLIKYVTVDPSTEAVSGRIQVGGTDVHNSSELGYTVRGAINVPLDDTAAVRASAFTRKEPGYVDNIRTGQDDVNELQSSGGRLAGLWKPSASFSVKLSAVYQKSKADGSSYVYQGLGDLEQSALLGTGRIGIEKQVYNATLAGKVGRLDLISISGYSVNHVTAPSDFSPFFFNSPTVLDFSNKAKKFSEEVRLSTTFGDRFAWLSGAFYTHEKSRGGSLIEATTPEGVAELDLEDFNNRFSYTEYAAFTDITYRITDRFDVQIGARVSENKQIYTQESTGPFARPPSPTIDTKAGVFTYLLTPRFKLSSDVMVYARLASGYRPGGPNSNVGPAVPSTFAADKTYSYEAGIKGDVLGGAVSFDGSLYYIDWKNIQLSLFTNGNIYFGNGSRAESEGVELSANARPIRGMTLSGWVAYDRACLTEDFPATAQVFGASGDRLPYSSRYSGSFSANQDFRLTENLTGYLGGSIRYVGKRLGDFTPLSGGASPRQILPAYRQIDLIAGFRLDEWALNVFVNNVTDKRGVISGGLGDYFPFAFTYIAPRTAGVNLSMTF